MNKYFLFLSALFFICITVLYAGGSSEKDTVQEAKIVQITGVVRLVGSAPFSEFVITGSDFEWYTPRDEREKLQSLQHRIVTVEGEETIIELRFANGLPAGLRRELRNIRVISVEQVQ
jgi:hypothetical protein